MDECKLETVTQGQMDQLLNLLDVKRDIMHMLWALQDPDDADWETGSRYGDMQLAISGMYYTAESIFREAENLSKCPIKGD